MLANINIVDILWLCYNLYFNSRQLCGVVLLLQNENSRVLMKNHETLPTVTATIPLLPKLKIINIRVSLTHYTY